MYVNILKDWARRQAHKQIGYYSINSSDNTYRKDFLKLSMFEKCNRESSAQIWLDKQKLGGKKTQIFQVKL